MKEKKSLVGSMPVEDIAGMMIDFWTKMRSGALTREQLAAFLRKKNPFEIKGGNEWINELVAKERATHIAFFGQVISSRFDYSILEKTLEKYDQAKVAKWAGVGLQVAFLPPVKMEQSACFPGFQVKPNNWFYEKIAEGKVDKKALCLGDIDKGGEVVLLDTRCKPNYNEGQQMWEDDEKYLGPIIEGLRKEGKIAEYKYGPQSSRFGVSAIEAEQYVYPALASFLGVDPCQVMSERVVQGSYLSQAYPELPRFNDGQTNTSVWLKEKFGGGRYRLLGGYSDCGGRAFVDYYSADDHWCFVSCLPLVVLSP